MKALSVFFALSAYFLLAGHLSAQAFRNPDRAPTTQDPISVFTGDVNGDGAPSLLNATVANPPGSSLGSLTGSVRFSDGASSLVGPIAATKSAAIDHTTYSVAGTHTLTASYSGEALHAAHSASLTEPEPSPSPETSTPKEWTWMGGSSTVGPDCTPLSNCGPPGVYGTL